MVMVSATMESSCLTEDDDVARSPCHCGSIGNTALSSLRQCPRPSTRSARRDRRTRRRGSGSIRARPSSPPLVFALLLASSMQTIRSASDDSDAKLSEYDEQQERWIQRGRSMMRGSGQPEAAEASYPGSDSGNSQLTTITQATTAASEATLPTAESNVDGSNGDGGVENSELDSNNTQQKQNTQVCHPQAKWHASVTKPKTCTNDDALPSSWERPSQGDKFLFGSWLDCCDGMFVGKDGCEKEDVCNGAVLDNGGSESDGGEVEGGFYERGHLCERRRWHPDITASTSTCTNSINGYPEYWDTPAMEGVTMFTNPTECCDKLKSHGALNAQDCFVRQARDCVKGPAGGYGACEASRRWHVSKDKDTTCTNDDDFPPDWKSSQYLGKTMFLSHEECCDALGAFGLSSCYVINVCTDPLYTMGIGSECTYPWHPSSNNNFHGCTNSPPGTYPKDWALPGVSDHYMYRTHKDCCDGFFEYDEGECPKVDYCPVYAQPTTPSPVASLPPTVCGKGNKWHRGKELNKCTNTLDYPFAWDNPDVTNEWLFDNPGDCCAEFVSTDICIVVDICGIMSMELEPGVPWTKMLATTTTTTTASTLLATTSSESTAISSSTTSTSKATTTIIHCEAKGKRQCVKDPACEWELSIKSCIDIISAGNVLDFDDCGSRKYHPTSLTERKCSNNAIFPSTWNSPDRINIYFFISGQDCCEAFYSDGPCKVADTCSSTDDRPTESKSTTMTTIATTTNPQSNNNNVCSERKWHPTSEFDHTCTNSNEYPAAWDESPKKYFFRSGKRCCRKYYGDDDGCDTVDVCS